MAGTTSHRVSESRDDAPRPIRSQSYARHGRPTTSRWMRPTQQSTRAVTARTRRAAQGRFTRAHDARLRATGANARRRRGGCSGAPAAARAHVRIDRSCVTPLAWRSRARAAARRLPVCRRWCARRPTGCGSGRADPRGPPLARCRTARDARSTRTRRRPDLGPGESGRSPTALGDALFGTAGWSVGRRVGRRAHDAEIERGLTSAAWRDGPGRPQRLSRTDSPRPDPSVMPLGGSRGRGFHYRLATRDRHLATMFRWTRSSLAIRGVARDRPPATRSAMAAQAPVTCLMARPRLQLRARRLSPPPRQAKRKVYTRPPTSTRIIASRRY
jgi:hypothetical protein